jgi:hypothetical protein
MRKLVIDLINYELRVKDINLKIDEDFLEINESFKDSVERDMIFSLFNYYYFLKNNDDMALLEKIYNSIYIVFQRKVSNDFSIFEHRILKENDVFIITIWYFFNKNYELFICFYSIILFKSLTKSLYSEDNIEYFTNSDIIIDNSSRILINFLIFFNIYRGYELDISDKNVRSHFFAIYEFLANQRIIEQKTI